MGNPPSHLPTGSGRAQQWQYLRGHAVGDAPFDRGINSNSYPPADQTVYRGHASMAGGHHPGQGDARGADQAHDGRQPGYERSTHAGRYDNSGGGRGKSGGGWGGRGISENTPPELKRIRNLTLHPNP
jgi:hypothetical protein